MLAELVSQGCTDATPALNRFSKKSTGNAERAVQEGSHDPAVHASVRRFQFAEVVEMVNY
jgi:hypothetical protein